MVTISRREISKRRFGPAFENECRRPAMIECALWECQIANCCQYDPRWAEAFAAGRAALNEEGRR